METLITVTTPYTSAISVNKAYRRGNPRFGKTPEAKAWLLEFLLLLQSRLAEARYVGPPEKVKIDVHLFCGRRGQKSDSQNFTKLSLDTIAQVLGVDDSIFETHTFPTERSDHPRIIFDITLS